MPADNAKHGWIASLSDGTTANEHHGDYTVIDGERKPFVRLCNFLLREKLHLTSLRYNANGTTYHAPKLDQRWNKGGIHPTGYSLEYVAEIEEDVSGVRSQALYVDIAAIYSDISVHTIIEIGDQQQVYTQVRQGYKPMAEAVAEEMK